MGYIDSNDTSQCFGCGACTQICSVNAICMTEDEEGFRYPKIDKSICISCNQCREVCPYEYSKDQKNSTLLAFGGYHKDEMIRQCSTSGGAFSAFAESWCGEQGVVFGAKADGIEVRHDYVVGAKEIGRFRKSKYVQSHIGNTYKQARNFLREGKQVLFSGTPCQIAGLRSFLRDENQEHLLTVEVVCEGVPSPLFIRSYDQHMQRKYGAAIETLDYRSKDKKKWDFQVMSVWLENGKHFQLDRWVNPFWPIWLAHLMSRPSCYECPYARPDREADITLGDLWGVHLYCPELYGRNGGASLILCNTSKGAAAFRQAEPRLFGHALDYQQAIKYQSPLRKPITENAERTAFINDLLKLPYDKLCKKWAQRPTLQLLWSKYVWGNRQKVFMWNLRRRLWGKRG